MAATRSPRLVAADRDGEEIHVGTVVLVSRNGARFAPIVGAKRVASASDDPSDSAWSYD